jgi:tetratricopeptide (TPR) repeat protein/predicted Ser/Thr protein kinase
VATEGRDPEKADTVASQPEATPAEVKTLPATPTDADGERDDPEKLGRYIVIGRLGAGGMGVVYSAYDPELDRKVALKLLLPGTASGEAAARLMREAQAMAKLSHPNVVPVYDVGTHEEQVYVAMEFVRGGSLRDWLAKEQRSWKEIVELFIQAGRGLAAAHEAGIIHRDFKPDNVLMGERGRARVTDFGLARAATEGTDAAATEAAVSSVLATPLTQHGAAIGTPAYMAPEQFFGGTIDHHTDQWAFCVALWEALYGCRPFSGDTMVELAASVRARRFTSPAPEHAEGSHTQRTVPKWLRRALERGLSDDRWPTMDALLAVLGSARARTRRRRLAIGILAVAALLAGTGAAYRYSHEQRVAACEQAGGAVAELWNEEVAARTRRALAATGIGYAERASENAIAWIDRWAKDWSSQRTDVCVAATVDGDLDDATYGQSVTCLDNRLTELQALLAALEKPDAGVVERAVSAAAGLPRLSLCSPHELGNAPVPEGSRAAILEVYGEIARSGASAAVARYDEARSHADSAESKAEQLGDPVLLARARMAAGNVADRTGDCPTARSKLEDAFYLAESAGEDRLAAEVAGVLTWVVGICSRAEERGLEWSRLAQARAAHLGWDDDLRLAKILSATAEIRRVRGESKEAIRMQKQVLDIRRSRLGDAHPDVAAAHANLGIAFWKAGDLEAALEHARRAMTLFGTSHGEHHPNFASALNLEASILFMRGKNTEALAGFERVVDIRSSTLGPGHFHVAGALSNVAIIQEAVGKLDEAGKTYERALAIFETALGPDHPDLIQLHTNLGANHQKRQMYDESLERYERALKIAEKLPPEHADTSFALRGYGQTLTMVKRHREAVEALERAVGMQEKLDLPPQEVAATRFFLADALVNASTRNRSRALALARGAKAVFEKDPHSSAQLAFVDEWLAAHGGAAPKTGD